MVNWEACYAEKTDSTTTGGTAVVAIRTPPRHMSTSAWNPWSSHRIWDVFLSRCRTALEDFFRNVPTSCQGDAERNQIRTYLSCPGVFDVLIQALAYSLSESQCFRILGSAAVRSRPMSPRTCALGHSHPQGLGRI